MLHVLVLVDDYKGSSFIQSRNKYYKEQGIFVSVLDCTISCDYEMDGIDVLTKKTYQNSEKNYDVLVVHAPNLRHHFVFIKRFGSRFKRFVFFFHGHEVVRINKTYPAPYDYMSESKWYSRLFQDIYDIIKLAVWHFYFPSVASKSDFIFVSYSFFEEFKHFTRLTEEKLNYSTHVINNPVGIDFLQNSYNSSKKKEFDIITVRSDMDSSVYCIDLCMKIAEKNPDVRFLIIGKGNWFKYNKKPNNVTWINSYLSHVQLMSYIDISRCALMLTRRDTQGVMSCELVTYGIPLITSDLKVCHEIFDDLPNVFFLKDIDSFNGVYTDAIKKRDCASKTHRYDYEHTVQKEVDLLTDLGRRG